MMVRATRRQGRFRLEITVKFDGTTDTILNQSPVAYQVRVQHPICFATTLEEGVRRRGPDI